MRKIIIVVSFIMFPWLSLITLPVILSIKFNFQLMWSYINVMISKTREYIKCQTLKHLFWHVVAYYKNDQIFRTTESNVVTGITNWCFTTEKLIFLLLVPVNQISNWQAWYIKKRYAIPFVAVFYTSPCDVISLSYCPLYDFCLH